MRSLVRAAAFVASISLVSGAVGQTPSAAPTAASDSTAAAAPNPDSTAPAAAPVKPVVPATGYSYGPPTTPRVESSTAPRVGPRTVRAARSHPGDSDALMAGFETLVDGSTRLFVDLSRPVAYDTKGAPATITYVLKGARVERRNNQNPLITVHFNTPVSSARLVPHGRDLWFVVDLRARVQPTATMDQAKDGAATLRIAFPKGDYLPPEPSGPSSPPSGDGTSAATERGQHPVVAAATSTPPADPSVKSAPPAAP
jgi:hypothetical protein